MARIPARWLLSAADERARAEGCTFSEKPGDYVIAFLETYCVQSKDEWAGRPLVLMDWQRDFLKRLYGWRRPDGSRRFRKAYLEVAKKNGKSTLVSGLSLYALVADGVGAPEVHINAFDRQQASIVFDEAERMVRSSPRLSAILECIPSRKLIAHKGANGKVQANSADVPSKDGANPSLVIFDELHRQATPAMWRVYRYAGKARRNPLLLSITTAGVDRQSVCYQEHEYTRKVNEGLIPDTAHLGVIYGADPKDDPDLPATWRKANPSLGVTLTEEGFREDLTEIAGKPSELNEFLRLRLCIWTNAVERFLSRAAWDACGGAVNPADLEGEECWTGLDLSTTVDLSAIVDLFADGSVLAEFFLPEDNLLEAEKRDRVPYGQWVREGYIATTPGASIDYGFIRERINARNALRPIRRIYCDPWNATQLATELKEDDGFAVEFLRQGYASLSAPTKELERLVAARELRHGSNPVLDWMCSNANVRRDPAGNLKLDKGQSGGRIDGMQALVNAIAARLADAGDGPSVYESRGLLYL